MAFSVSRSERVIDGSSFSMVSNLGFTTRRSRTDLPCAHGRAAHQGLVRPGDRRRRHRGVARLLPRLPRAPLPAEDVDVEDDDAALPRRRNRSDQALGGRRAAEREPEGLAARSRTGLPVHHAVGVEPRRGRRWRGSGWREGSRPRHRADARGEDRDPERSRRQRGGAAASRLNRGMGALMRTDLTEIFRHDGPFATAYLTSKSDIENAAHELGIHWKSVRRSLEGQGATEAMLAALDAAVADTNHAAGDTLALVAAGDTVLLNWHLPEPPTNDIGWVSSLPRIATVLEAEQTLLPHLVVLVDRTGADIYGFTASGRSIEREVGDDDGQDVQRVQAGGWSQRRYQERAVNEWKDNAHDVADEVARLAKRTDARLIAVGGDVYALNFLKEAIPVELQPLLRDVGGATRHVDGGLDHI